MRKEAGEKEDEEEEEEEGESRLVLVLCVGRLQSSPNPENILKNKCFKMFLSVQAVLIT